MHLNLSALLARRSGDDGRELLAEALGIIERGLSRCPFDPALGVQQGAVLRRLGQQAEALNRAWAALEYHRGRRQQQPQPTPPPSDPAAAPSQPEPAAAQALHVLMAKVGSKYPADHANRLARAVRRHLPLRAPPLRILCLTDDASGLDMEAIDEALPVPDAQLPGWWAKAHLFSPALPVPPGGESFGTFITYLYCSSFQSSYQAPRLNPSIDHHSRPTTNPNSGAPILYLDLDTVIVGDLRPLLGFFADAAAPTLAALGTEGLQSEGGRPRGLNTSVLLWRAHDPLWAPLSTDVGPEVVEVVRKLDWWVEMVAARGREERDGDGDGVLRVQERWPGLVVEYKDLIGLGGDGGCVWNQQPGEGAAVVVFPLRPKPADLVETVPWVQEHWR